MAGTPERPINQPLSGEAKSRIGSFHLRQLLEADLVAFDVGHFKDINDDTFSEFFSIPPSLIEELKLDKLNWQAIHSANNPMYNQLPVVIKGAEKNHALEKDADINNAMATIEIARRVNLQTGHYIPILVRIAGVTRNNRVVAATYDLTEDNRLTELNVSMPYSECPAYLNDDWDTSWNLRSLLVTSLPTYKKRPYETAAFITPEMQRAAQDNGGKHSPHNSALIFQFDVGNDSVFPGKALDPLDPFAKHLKVVAAKLGYYVKRENNMLIVGLSSEALQRRGSAPWEIHIPAALQKA